LPCCGASACRLMPSASASLLFLLLRLWLSIGLCALIFALSSSLPFWIAFSTPSSAVVRPLPPYYISTSFSSKACVAVRVGYRDLRVRRAEGLQ
jgi:hypothetical protein